MKLIDLGVILSMSVSLNCFAGYIGCDDFDFANEFRVDNDEFVIKKGPSTYENVLIDSTHTFKASRVNILTHWSSNVHWYLSNVVNGVAVVNNQVATTKLNIDNEDNHDITLNTVQEGNAIVWAQTGEYCNNSRIFIIQNTPKVNSITYNNTGVIDVNTNLNLFTTTYISDWATNSSNYVNWDFDDGTVSNGNNITHKFAKAGTYNIRVNAFDGKFSATKVLPVWVRGPAEPPRWVNEEFTQCVNQQPKYFINWERTGTNFIVEKKVGTSWVETHGSGVPTFSLVVANNSSIELRIKAQDPTYGSESAWKNIMFNSRDCVSNSNPF